MLSSSVFVDFSVVVSISLHGTVIDYDISLDECLGDLLVGVEALDWGPVKVDLIVDDQKRVVCVHHIVVDTHTVQVLLEQRLKEHVLLLQRSLLFLDGKFVEEHLIEAFVELIE